MEIMHWLQNPVNSVGLVIAILFVAAIAVGISSERERVRMRKFEERLAILEKTVDILIALNKRNSS